MSVRRSSREQEQQSKKTGHIGGRGGAIETVSCKRVSREVKWWSWYHVVGSWEWSREAQITKMSAEAVGFPSLM